MYEVVVHLDPRKKSVVGRKIVSLLPKFNLTREVMTSVDGELSTYFHLDVDKDLGERIIKELDQIKDIDGVYLKHKGVPPTV